MSDGKTFTPKHLKILRWFKTIERDWVSIKRAERECRIDGQKLAIAEELLELTAQPANAEPLLRLHRSGKHYRITARGLEACDKYTTRVRDIELGPGKKRTVEEVVLAASGRAPRAEIVGDTEPPLDDDDDDDLPQETEDDLTGGRGQEDDDGEVFLEDTEPPTVPPTRPEPRLDPDDAQPAPSDAPAPAPVQKKRSLPKKKK